MKSKVLTKTNLNKLGFTLSNFLYEGYSPVKKIEYDTTKMFGLDQDGLPAYKVIINGTRRIYYVSYDLLNEIFTYGRLINIEFVRVY